MTTKTSKIPEKDEVEVIRAGNAIRVSHDGAGHAGLRWILLSPLRGVLVGENEDRRAAAYVFRCSG